jgi:hypothetical protein
MIALMMYSQFIVQPPDHSRSHAWTYQNENPKKTKTNTIKMRSSIPMTPQLLKLDRIINYRSNALYAWVIYWVNPSTPQDKTSDTDSRLLPPSPHHSIFPVYLRIIPILFLLHIPQSRALYCMRCSPFHKL